MSSTRDDISLSIWNATLKPTQRIGIIIVSDACTLNKYNYCSRRVIRLKVNEPVNVLQQRRAQKTRKKTDISENMSVAIPYRQTRIIVIISGTRFNNNNINNIMTLFRVHLYWLRPSRSLLRLFRRRATTPVMIIFSRVICTIFFRRIFHRETVFERHLYASGRR